MLIGVMAAVVAGALPASAEAAPRQTLRGDLDPSGSAVVRTKNVKRHDYRLTVYEATFRDVPLACTDGTSASIDLGTGRLANGRADDTVGLDVVTVGSATGPSPSAWRMRLKVLGPRRIEGTLRFYDHQFAAPNDSTRDCESGRLDWSVKRADRAS